jgi:hypothetical protein
MTDARWADVEDEMRRAMGHYSRAVRLFDAGGFAPEEAASIDDLEIYRNQMALLHSMQSAHRTLEGGLIRILEILGEEVPTGANSHADLTTRVSRPLDLQGHERPAILGPEAAADVDESRRFRHRPAHGYDNFDPVLARPAIDAARRLQAALWPCIRAFRDVIDPN